MQAEKISIQEEGIPLLITRKDDLISGFIIGTLLLVFQLLLERRIFVNYSVICSKFNLLNIPID